MKTQYHRSFIAVLAIAIGFSGAFVSATSAAVPKPAKNCPGFGWSEGLGKYLSPGAAFPTTDTAKVPTPDCNFHEWSWEAFVWAVAPITDPVSNTTVPRFLTLATEADLLKSGATAAEPHPLELKLAARSEMLQGQNGFSTGAGAIVEADGNMLVAQNGYPVYASIHMNNQYLDTARKNMIFNKGYENQPVTSTFPVGAAVFKATWLRLDPGQAPPAGAYTTQAQMPILAEKIIPGRSTIEPVPGKFVTVTVALIGLHVVGHTVNHQEFLWGTFEQKLNSPVTPDNTFTPSSSRKDPNNYTLYKANTPFSAVNLPKIPPTLRLNPTTQKLTPVTNVVLENNSGGENQPHGPGNIAVLNKQAQGFLAGQKPWLSKLASYYLVGTVWMKPNSYNLKSDQNDAVGSVNLANSTAETFVQHAKDARLRSCFNCHNPTSYSFQTPPPAKLPDRLIGLSHALSVGSAYEVPNSISGNLQRCPTCQ